MHGFFEGISFRLAKVGVVLALIIGMLMSAVQIYLDFRSQLLQIQQDMEMAVRVARAPAERAIFTLDTELADEVASSLMQHNYIVEAALKDESGVDVARQSKEVPLTNTSWISELLTKNRRTMRADVYVPRYANKVGSIEFTVDMDLALARFYRSAALVISIGLIRSSVLVFFLFIAFYNLLTKPLIRITSEIRKINPGSPGEQRISVSEDGVEDEMKQLVTGVNQMLDAVDLALAKRRAVEVVLRKSEEHVRQIIDSLPVWVSARNRDGHYIFANKALADFLQTTPDAMRGAHLSEYQSFFASDSGEINRKDAEVIDTRTSAQIWEEKWLSADGEEHHMHTHIMPMEFYDEVVTLVVSSDITELKKTQQLMEHMAYHDALTNLPNRSYLIERLDEELKKAVKLGHFGSLLFIDLDQFKNINDSLGHPVGDGVLKHVAERLSAHVSVGDVVVRLGGDEFVVVLTQLGRDMPTAILKAEGVAERLRTAVFEPHFHNDLQLHVTCSVGIVMFPEEDAGVHELLRYADTAMYRVKEQGRDSIEFFNKHMAVNARKVLMLEGELHKALDNRHFSLHYQPRVDTRSSRIVGAEALLRWNHPERGLISPVEFIPVLETSGLIVDVGMWVLQEAISQVNAWMEAGLWDESMRLGVNISPRQFRSLHFVEEVSRMLLNSNFPARMLELEITEGIVIQNLDVTIDTMSMLGRLGIVFALDDFGTGYSSISYLKKLPVSVLKIDKSFVRDITEDRNDRVLVETISAMGNLLQLEVVAEGVETLPQLELLKQYGCAYYQGFLCSKPVPANLFAHLLGKKIVDWIA